MANEQFAIGPTRTRSAKVVVFFTDGRPTAFRGNIGMPGMEEDRVMASGYGGSTIAGYWDDPMSTLPDQGNPPSPDGCQGVSVCFNGWNSTTAMYRPGKILQFGGNSNGAIVIDINGPTPTVTPTQSMSSQRRWVNATVMADGRVVATGGSRVDNQLTDVNNIAEIWDPDTGQWHQGAEGALARAHAAPDSRLQGPPP